MTEKKLLIIIAINLTFISLNLAFGSGGRGLAGEEKQLSRYDIQIAVENAIDKCQVETSSNRKWHYFDC